MRLKLAPFLSVTLVVPLLFLSSSCLPSSVPRSPSGAGSTQFQRMLGEVPASFLKEHDIWFSDLARMKQLSGFGNVNNAAAFNALSQADQEKLDLALGGTPGPFIDPNWTRVSDLLGFDRMMITQTAFVDVPPPWSFSIAEGNFDAKLIGSDLTSQGYSKETYGADTYYGIREDFGISLQPDNSLRTVMAHFNRVAVSDHRLIITPATTVLTPVLDALSGKVPSAISSPEVQAVSASMGDVLSGVVIGSDRVLQFSPTVKGPTFNFTIPSDWGKLHQYSMVGSGYRYDGKDHYWLISIYYPDRNAAAADAPELVKRINSYMLDTWGNDPDFGIPLVNRFAGGQPQTRQFDAGSTLTIEAKFKPLWSGPTGI